MLLTSGRAREVRSVCLLHPLHAQPLAQMLHLALPRHKHQDASRRQALMYLNHLVDEDCHYYGQALQTALLREQLINGSTGGRSAEASHTKGAYRQLLSIQRRESDLPILPRPGIGQLM